jgi:hypothetical protein
MRNYLSTQHLWTATHMSRLAVEYERAYVHTAPAFHIHQRGYVLATVTESVAFLEALINELFQDAHDSEAHIIDQLGQPTATAMAQYWQETDLGWDRTLQKFDKARELASATPPQRGRVPYQDAQLLIQLRNWMIHYRPSWVGTHDPHDLEARLRRNRFEGCKLMKDSGNAWFPDEALGAGCSTWAVKTVRAFADEFVNALGVTLNFQLVDHPAEPPTPA